ncbi:MAG TPA: SDR family oxidoreductase [Ilumatobacter sp.]|nr:SDR family oxidoreductase [Ilumatobacter sp.]
MNSATGRTALVTGAARGVGLAVVERLLADGHRVAMLDVAETLTDVARSLDATATLAVHCDVGEPDSIDRAVNEVRQRWGDVDVLVNNAARTVARSVWEISAAEWDDVLRINLRSVQLMTQAWAPAMRDRRWGRIVNMSSIAGQQGGAATGAHYAASKAGILALTKVWAKELASHGTTVNAVTPSLISTPVMDDMDPALLERARAALPVGRFGTAAEVAGLVAYLVGVDAAFVTGATFDINGGVLMR